MACCNKSCPNFHYVNSATIVGGQLILTFSDAPAGVADREKFCFRICADMPTGYEGLPVVATINGAGQPVWNKYGDIMVGRDLITSECCCGSTNINKRYVYKGYFGIVGEAAHLIVTNAPEKRCNNCCGYRG